MELDDLKAAWTALDRKVDAGIALNLRLMREIRSDKARSILGRLRNTLNFEVVAGVAAVALVGWFLGTHLDRLWLAVVSSVVLAGALLSLITTIRQLEGLSRIDPSGPVVETQAALARLRSLRIASYRWVFLLSPLIWSAMVIAVAGGVFRFTFADVIGSRWIIANVLFASAVPLVGVWISRRYRDRLDRSPLLKRIGDEFAGRSLVEARGRVEEIARFDSEEGVGR